MKRLFLLTCIVALFISCNDDDPNDPNFKNPTVSGRHVKGTDYFPLKIGNYWIYNVYKIDEAGDEILLNYTDSVVVVRDTIIRGNHYFIMERKQSILEPNSRTTEVMLRDSSGYLVNEYGIIQFSATNFTDILYSISETGGDGTLIYSASYMMEKVTDHVVVPAGVFEALAYKGKYIVYHGDSIYARRETCAFYAKRVGMIQNDIAFLISPLRYEKRLVRYHLN